MEALAHVRSHTLRGFGRFVSDTNAGAHSVSSSCSPPSGVASCRLDLEHFSASFVNCGNQSQLHNWKRGPVRPLKLKVHQASCSHADRSLEDSISLSQNPTLVVRSRHFLTTSRDPELGSVPLLQTRRGGRRVRAGGDGPTNEEQAQYRELEKFYESLDLEYESVWDTKPAWCQPWTILLTGTVGITGSWQLLHVPILTGVVTGLVGVWWFVFLLAYPQSYKEMVAQRREYQERLAAENGRPVGRE